MFHYKETIWHKDYEVVRKTCNKCKRSWEATDPTCPDFTTIAHRYGFGSSKDQDMYVSHICEPCMDAIYATFAVMPQVIGQYDIQDTTPEALLNGLSIPPGQYGIKS